MFRYFDYESAPFEPALPAPDCTLLAPLLTAYFDLEAPGADAARVQQHLADCARCAQMWRDWGDTRALLHSMAAPAPPHTLAREIVQASRLFALLPVAPATGALTRANADVPLPPQLHHSILAATVGSNQSTLDHALSATHQATPSPRYARSLRASKAWATMATVPALALWLIVATANHSTTVPSPISHADTTIAPAFSKPTLNRAQGSRRAQSLLVPTPNAGETRAATSARLVVPIREESASAPVANVETHRHQSSAPTGAVVSWPEHQSSAPTIAPATPMIAPALAIRLRSAQPLSSPALSAPAPRSVQNSILTAPQTARPVARTIARTALVARTNAPRRGAKLSTVAMETPALSSAPRSLTAAGELPRMVMANGAALQKATLPVALSRDTGDEGLWQSDVAPGRSALAVVQALNDNRPGELRDAFDAYAQTLLDDSDGSSSTL